MNDSDKRILTMEIIYVHDNGEVEGFSGKGSTLGIAYKDAIGKIENKLRAFGEIFSESRIKKDLTGLTPEQRNKVREDFKK